MTKNALVTGGFGFIGSNLVETLIKKGYKVRATHFRKHSFKEDEVKGVEYRYADITNKDSLKFLLEDIDIIFHTAGLFKASASREELFKVNAEGTKNICEAALNQNIKAFVHWSSASIYGNNPPMKPTTEDAPVAPSNAYEESKAAGEDIALSYHKENSLPVSVLRPTAVYGPGSMYGTYMLVKMLASQKYFVMPGDGNARLSNVHVDDVINAGILLSQKKESAGQVYNIADDSIITLNEAIDTLKKALNLRRKVIHASPNFCKAVACIAETAAKIFKKEPMIEKDTLNWIIYDHAIDNQKIKKLGLKLKWPKLEDGIKATMHWYHEKGIL